MRALITFGLLLLFSINTNAQKIVKSSAEVPFLIGCDQRMPEFPGGNAAFSKYLQTTLIFPKGQKKQGKLIVDFVIEKNGMVTDVTLTRKLSPLYDAEVLRVVKASPKWRPGTLNKKPINVRYSLPIDFSTN
jgi:hypothetical protein